MYCLRCSTSVDYGAHMTTRQTAEPVEPANLTPSAREAAEMDHLVAKRQIVLAPPYQRGSVWTESQRMSLVFSWLRGLPTGVLILSNRDTPGWAAAHGDVHLTGAPAWAVVDGQQRLLAARRGFRTSSRYRLPGSQDQLTETEPTADGPYVRHCGLTRPGRLKTRRRAVFQVSEFKTAAAIADEAAMYVLVNGGGTLQTSRDMQRARSIASSQA